MSYRQDNLVASQTKLHGERSLHHGTIITHTVLNLQDASEALLLRRYVGQLRKRPDYGHSVQLVVLETLGLYPFRCIGMVRTYPGTQIFAASTTWHVLGKVKGSRVEVQNASPL